MDAQTFIGRMIQHVVPKGFKRVRYYGVQATKTFAKLKLLIQAAWAKVQHMVVWRMWHPKYGVIYDEAKRIQRGDYDRRGERAPTDLDGQVARRALAWGGVTSASLYDRGHPGTRGLGARLQSSRLSLTPQAARDWELNQVAL